MHVMDIFRSIVTGTFSNTMKFVVKDCDPNTGEADEEGYNDEYVVRLRSYLYILRRKRKTLRIFKNNGENSGFFLQRNLWNLSLLNLKRFLLLWINLNSWKISRWLSRTMFRKYWKQTLRPPGRRLGTSMSWRTRMPCHRWRVWEVGWQYVSQVLTGLTEVHTSTIWFICRCSEADNRVHGNAAVWTVGQSTFRQEISRPSPGWLLPRRTWCPCSNQAGVQRWRHHADHRTKLRGECERSCLISCRLIKCIDQVTYTYL